MTARAIAVVLGIFFLAVGVLGFIPNPLVSPEGIFQVNPARNVLHLFTGVVLLASFFRFHAKARLKTVGAVYTIIAILGFVAVGPDQMILGILHVAEADKWFHVTVAAILLAAGFGLPERAAT